MSKRLFVVRRLLAPVPRLVTMVRDDAKTGELLAPVNIRKMSATSRASVSKLYPTLSPALYAVPASTTLLGSSETGMSVGKAELISLHA